MARNSSEFVKALGTGFEIMSKLSVAVRELGGSDADLRKILEKESSLPGEIAKLLVDKAVKSAEASQEKFGRFGKIYPTTVSNFHGFDWLLKRANQNGGVNADITEANFPIETSGFRDVSFELYEFDETVTGVAAVKRIEDEGLYKIENIAALLAFAKESPIAQLRRRIIALGSRWQNRDGNVNVPCLYGDGERDRRYLGLYDLGGKFDTNFLFLVSRKVK